MPSRLALRLRRERTMRSSCQLVPWLLLFALAPGCYLSHDDGSVDCGPPPGQVCCDAFGSVVPPAADCPYICPRGATLVAERTCIAPPPPIDAGPPPIDAGPPPACPSVRADAVCLESFGVTPGHAFELPLTFDTCSCCAASECRVEVTSVEGTPTLRIETTLCPDPCECDACVRPEVSCSVPALTEGDWNVVVNGAPAFSLPVFEDSGLVPPPPACASFAEVDHCSVSDGPIGADAWMPTEVCVRDAFEGTTIEVSSDCWSCQDLHGPCVATVEPRFTDDLPPGGEIRVVPTMFQTMCDVDCPAVCIPATRRCLVPELVPGDYYRVWVNGVQQLSIVAGSPASACASGG